MVVMVGVVSSRGGGGGGSSSCSQRRVYRTRKISTLYYGGVGVGGK